MPQTTDEIKLGTCRSCDRAWGIWTGFSPRIPLPNSERWVCKFCVRFLLREEVLRIAKRNPKTKLARTIIELHGSLDEAKRWVVHERIPKPRTTASEQTHVPESQQIPTVAESASIADAIPTPATEQEAATQPQPSTAVAQREKPKRSPKQTVKLKQGSPVRQAISVITAARVRRHKAGIVHEVAESL